VFVDVRRPAGKLEEVVEDNARRPKWQRPLRCGGEEVLGRDAGEGTILGDEGRQPVAPFVADEGGKALVEGGPTAVVEQKAVGVGGEFVT